MTLGTLDNLTETLDRFRGDLPLYSEAVLVIRNKDALTEHLKLNEAQLITHAALSKQLKETGRIRAVILKARQEGISTYVAARFFRSIHLWSNMVAMVVADSLERAGALSDIYNRYYENLPNEIKPRRLAIERRRYLAFGGDSEISVRPSSDTEAGRALTVHRLHASELAYWGPTARETWTSLMQAVPRTGSEVIVESTAKGAGGLFHELWEAAEQGESGWVAIFLPWWVHEEYEFVPDEDTRKLILEDPDDFEKQAMGEGIFFQGKKFTLGVNKLAWRRQRIVEAFGGDPVKLGKDAVREFQREYPATAEEAFLVSGSCFFDEEVLRLMTTRVSEPKRGRLLLEPEKASEAGTVTPRRIWLEPNQRGFVRLYEPPDANSHYVVGVDTATGKEVSRKRTENPAEAERYGRDFSAAVVLKLGDVPKVVAELHGKIAPEIFTEQLRLLGEFYSCGGKDLGTYGTKAMVGVEQGHSSGQTVLRLLREVYRYTPLYWHREINRLTRKIGRRIGWRTDAVSRMPMLDETGRLVRLDGIDIPSKDLLREMVTFVLWPDGKPAAEEGCHDDRVIALAIAVQMMREHRHALMNPMPAYEVDEDSLTG